MRRKTLALLVALTALSSCLLAACRPAPAVQAQRGEPPPRLPAAPAANPPDFPRLGMWWPDLWNQPAAEVARYDWVIFGEWDDRQKVAQVKALNPELLALNATNASELGFDPNGGPLYNQDVLAIPPEWFLTQVGSTLRQGVNLTQTDLPVEATTASDGSTVYKLFVPGDTALIGGESVLVEAVNHATRTLTVQRGYVRPAAAHAAGARIAAHITFWPNSWLLNLSTFCPPAVISPTLGAETWASYNARIAAGLLDDPIWDGILLDRSDPNESWLIGNSTARTIDPDQTNTLLSDYTAFDAAWNAGLRQYESALRAAVGAEKIIFANWGMSNYDLLNGNNFEGFPDDQGTAYGESWRTAVFGPWFGKGSYFEWLELAQQPNLTMIETYEVDGGPDPTGGGEFDNPCDDPGFVPNYRKMRFGLAIALLHDGYFSYEINTNGHGSLCLLWFDEYDNAGRGRGYLGQPLGAAQRAMGELTTPNLVSGGGFDSQDDLDKWYLWADSGYAASVAMDALNPAQGSAAARITIAQTQGVDWQISLSYEPFAVSAGQDTTLSLWARADRPRTVTALVQQNHDPWETWLWYGYLALDTAWQRYEIAAPATGSDGQAVLHFGMGQELGEVWLDDVRLQEGSRDVWRRDYAGGLALVNATGQAQTVSLGGFYRKINGAQDPAVNDGALVTQATLPPNDGLILLRLPNLLFLPQVLQNLP